MSGNEYVDMKEAQRYVSFLPAGTPAMINGRAYVVVSIKGTHVWKSLSAQEATYMVRSTSERTYTCGKRNGLPLRAVIR